MVRKLVRALRLPFVSASILPFILGSLIRSSYFNPLTFLCGLLAVFFAHSSANLINDYFDSRSGADWHDRRFYSFFGGSKLIQEGLLSEKFYLSAALFCALAALVCVIILSLVLKTAFVVLMYLAIIFLSWQYTAWPLRLSYNYLGEFFLFFLFGPALVMGGYFIQTGIFPDLKSFVLSLAPGFFTTAILFANEVPDLPDDKKAGKNNLVALCGAGKAFLLYYLLIFSGFGSIALCVYMRYLKPFAALSFLLIFPAVRAGFILKNNYSDKLLLLRSSALTINIQMLASVILILGLFI